MKLTEWLDQVGADGKKLMTRAEFARRIEMSPAAVTLYCAGTIWPSREVAERIAKETGGHVTPNDFLREPPPVPVAEGV